MVKPVTNVPRISGHFHAVRFYENKESLCRIVAEFIGEGLVVGQPGLIIGTPEHLVGIVDALRERHFDVERIQRSGDLALIDARETLTSFMIDGLPNADLFQAHTSEALARLCRGRTDCTVRAYGEMVDLLWKDGHSVAAIQLEMLWNKLALTHDFSLLCGYSMGNFYKDASISDICHQHTHAIAPDGTAVATSSASSAVN